MASLRESRVTIGQSAAEGMMLVGTGVSRGYAIGKAILIRRDLPEVAAYSIAERLIVAEVERFRHALQVANEQLMRVRDHLSGNDSVEAGALIETHMLMLQDSSVCKAPIELIKNRGCNAEWALKVQRDRLIDVFEAMDDPYLRARKNDVHQVITRIQRVLLDEDAEPAESAGRLAGRVVVSDDLSPADAIMMRHRGVLAFVTTYGGPLSHTAILARSFEIPAVVGAREALRRIRDDQIIIVDGASGEVQISPADETLVDYRNRQSIEVQRRLALADLKEEPATTRDGIAISLFANIELPEDTWAAKRVAAAGVGLYRTEFLFMNRNDVPDEEEHLASYREVIEQLGSGPITIRTLDLGADKQVDGGRNTGGPLPNNPALGLRAIRLCLKDLALFQPQLRAILRASASGRVRMMIPMLSNTEEVFAVLRLVEESKQALRQEGLAFDEQMPIGGMIEVPAAAVCAPYFARHLDFLSIGTNDLIQYSLAIDRIDDDVNYLYDPLHPAVLQLIHLTLKAGREASIPVGLCGEMASDPRYTKLLLGLGLTEFSTHPNSLLEVKHAIKESSVDELHSTAERIVATADSAEFNALLTTLTQ